MLSLAINEVTILKSVENVLAQLNTAERKDHTSLGYIHPPDFWHSKERRKFWALDCGGSGAFLVEKTTGEIFNIKSAYGVPDYNKKKKANLGNIQTVDGEWLQTKRWNYLK